MIEGLEFLPWPLFAICIFLLSPQTVEFMWRSFEKQGTCFSSDIWLSFQPQRLFLITLTAQFFFYRTRLFVCTVNFTPRWEHSLDLSISMFTSVSSESVCESLPFLSLVSFLFAFHLFCCLKLQTCVTLPSLYLCADMWAPDDGATSVSQAWILFLFHAQKCTCYRSLVLTSSASNA